MPDHTTIGRFLVDELRASRKLDDTRGSDSGPTTRPMQSHRGNGLEKLPAFRGELIGQLRWRQITGIDVEHEE